MHHHPPICTDKAQNEWDMDKDKADIQRKVQWCFFIDASGRFKKVSDATEGIDETID